MPQWINVDAATGRYRGWQRSSKGDVPASDAATLRIEADDSSFAAVLDLHGQAIDDGRADALVYADGQFALEPDTRPIFRVETEPQAQKGIDHVFTVSAVDTNGTVLTSVNGARRMQVGERIFNLNFVNGVATRTFAFDHSGIFRIVSIKNYKVETPVIIEVAE